MVPEDLVPTYERLVSILRLLCSCNVRAKFPSAEVIGLSKELRSIQQQLGAPDPIECSATLAECYAQRLQELMSTEKTDGRSLVTDLLARNTLWAQLMLKRPGYVEDGFEGVYKNLNSIRSTLESKFLVQTWSIRETDLYIYQRQLDKIDNSRNARGDFVDAEGKVAELQTQRTLLYLLRKSYALIYRMLTSSQPVSEALLPIYNQLKTLLLCLREVDKAGVTSPRDLYPYSMKLASIDRLKVNGNFIVNDEVPDGQDVLHALLSECSQTIKDLAAHARAPKSDKLVAGAVPAAA